jgi:hypothetical protein
MLESKALIAEVEASQFESYEQVAIVVVDPEGYKYISWNPDFGTDFYKKYPVGTRFYAALPTETLKEQENNS